MRQVACGSGHTLALTDGGDVYSWGTGWCGCLGHGKQSQSFAAPTLVKALCDVHNIQVACGAKHSMTVTTTGYLYAWGDNAHGQLGNGKEAEEVDVPQQIFFEEELPVCVNQVSCGTVHNAAVDVQGRVFAWGSNVPIGNSTSCLTGRLGITTATQLKPRLVEEGAMTGERVRVATTGLDHTAVLTEAGRIIFWGFLRRPRKWQDQGYGPLPTAAVMVPQYVSGDWEKVGKVAVALASGSNKCLVIVESPSEAEIASITPESKKMSSGESPLQAVAAVAAVSVDDGEAMAVENARLKAQVQELNAELNKAQHIFSRYMPFFSVSRDRSAAAPGE